MTTPPENISELKSCPFCGSDAEHYQPNEDVAVISCTGCGAESGYLADSISTTPADAARLWNTRAATTPAAVVTVSELNKMIDPQMPSFRNIGNMLLEKYAGRAIIITADSEKENN